MPSGAGPPCELRRVLSRREAHRMRVRIAGVDLGRREESQGLQLCKVHFMKRLSGLVFETVGADSRRTWLSGDDAQRPPGHRELRFFHTGRDARHQWVV